MSDPRQDPPRQDPIGPYDPQPQPNDPTPPSTPPGHAPLEVPAAPSITPQGIPAIDPDNAPGPSMPDPGPSMPTGPVA